jgi:hypothetical protein
MAKTFAISPFSTPVDKNGDRLSVEWNSFFQTTANAVNSLYTSGTTAQRPTNAYLGQIYFDTTLNQLVFVNSISSSTVTWQPINSFNLNYAVVACNSTGFTVTASANITILNIAAGVTSGTVTLPTGVDGQIVKISASSQGGTIPTTTITVNAAGGQSMKTGQTVVMSATSNGTTTSTNRPTAEYLFSASAGGWIQIT